jgi:hypothetical protein
MAVGDLVWYNEAPVGDANAPAAWAPGVICATPTSNPGAAAYFNDPDNSYAGEDYGPGTYPTPPETGQVLISYWASLNFAVPAPNAAYATEGTGPGEYQTSDPTS